MSGSTTVGDSRGRRLPASKPTLWVVGWAQLPVIPAEPASSHSGELMVDTHVAAALLAALLLSRLQYWIKPVRQSLRRS
ncbi:hypothetical protein [Arthrobacter sp.]|uniref:hypothetical protein n=1 Tax=Arthrobacter sp. TaxID=1667 RepID=UPI002811EEBC|nr:hypothetical protein [Arthrobacter sp.]